MADLFDLLLPRSDRNSADRMLAYDASHLLGRMLLARGLTPIFECTYSRLSQRISLVEAVADLPSVPFRVVEFAVSPVEAVRRYRDSPSHQVTDLNEQLVWERADTYPFSADALRLDSGSAPPADLAHRIRTWLEQRPPSIDRGQWVLAGKPDGVP